MRTFAAIGVGLALTAAPPAASEGARPSAAWSVADMDPTCEPCQDFYQYANGGWLAANPVPADRSRWSSYEEADSRTRQVLRQILEDGVAAANAGQRRTPLAKLGLFYSTCLDQAQADALGMEPIQADLDRLDALTTRDDIFDALVEVKRLVPDLFFWADVEADHGERRQTLLQVKQAGLSLGEAPPYLEADADARAAVSHLRDSARSMFRLAGMSEAEAADAAGRVVAFEAELARSFIDPEAGRDVDATYNRMTAAEATRLSPMFDWARYIQAAGGPDGAYVNIANPQFIQGLGRMMAERPLEDWRAYLKWHLLREAAPWLSEPFAEQAFAFNQVLSGARRRPSREAACTSVASTYLGDALGRIYLERTFDRGSERRARRMVANIKAAMRDRIDRMEWLSPSTRQEARRKLDNVLVHVGGPKRTIDYAPLVLNDQSFLVNLRATIALVTRHHFRRINKPIDRGDWYVYPQSYSAAADAARNMFMFPAAKFQAPFFDPLADDALNYGSIGATMAHELTHLFDDRGRGYDHRGLRREWWTTEEIAAFDARAALVRDQFDGYLIDEKPVNGTLTLSENIADLGGVSIAYDALQRDLSPSERRLIDGFTPEQRFFLSWARNFRGAYTPQAQAARLRTDPHAPFKWRVNGPLSHLPEFAAAFDCPPDSPMTRLPETRARIW